MWYTQPSHGIAAGNVTVLGGLVRTERRNSHVLNIQIQVLEALAKF